MSSTIPKYDQLPEILYEAPTKDGQKTSPIPYIEVAKNKIMPPVLFIFEYKETGEHESDENGRPQMIVDQIPHKYFDLEFVKEKLSPELFDTIRTALGMQPLKEAQRSGQKILDKVLAKTDALKTEALDTQDERINIFKKNIEEANKKVN